MSESDNIWDLFDEDAAEQQFEPSSASGVASGGTDGASRSRAGPAPPAPRGITGLAGLSNLGATCYLNALIQTLFHTPGFRKRLFALEDAALGVGANGDETGRRVRRIPLELQKLFARMLHADSAAMALNDLTASFGWARQQEVIQQDVNELNRVLFTAIDQSLKGTDQAGLITDMYEGTMCNLIQCMGCGNTRERDEQYRDISISVSGLDTLEAGLAHYTEMELLSGDNCYFCEICNGKQEAMKGIRFRDAPPILTVALNRYTFDWERGTRRKEKSRFAFPRQLDFEPYCMHKDGRSPDALKYQLYSVVVHKGGAHGGHYFSLTRDVYGTGAWVPPPLNNRNKQKKSGRKGSKIEGAKAGGGGDGGRTGIYSGDHGVKKDDVLSADGPTGVLQAVLRGLGAISMGLLCKKITQETGLSWNRAYKKNHGSIRAFLGRNKQLFVLTDDDMVSLADESVEPSDDGRPGDAEREGVADDEGGSAPVPVPHGWYELNDNRVKCIREADIEDTFSGDRCAYMLFYARTDFMAVPGKTEPPARIASNIATTNAALEAARQAYDVSLNRVELTVHLGAACGWGGCFLETGSPGSERSIIIDHRVPMAELRTLVLAAFGLDSTTDAAGGDNSSSAESPWLSLLEQLYPGKWFPGPAILDTLDAVPVTAAAAPSQVEEAGVVGAKALLFGAGAEAAAAAGAVQPSRTTTVKAAGIRHGSALLLWDGRTIGGVEAATSVSDRPVSIHCTHLQDAAAGGEDGNDVTAKTNNNNEYTLFLPLSATLGGLRDTIAGLTGVPRASLQLHRLDRVPKGAWGTVGKAHPEEIPVASDGDTLTFAEFASDIRLTAEAQRAWGGARATAEADRITRNLVVSVTNLCGGGPNFKEMRPSVDPDATVEVVKAQLVERIRRVVPDLTATNTRMRLVTTETVSSGLATLLDKEQRTLSRCGVVAGSELILERGILPGAPGASGLLLRFGLGVKARHAVQEAVTLATTTTAAQGETAGKADGTATAVAVMAEGAPDLSGARREHFELTFGSKALVGDVLAQAVTEARLPGNDWHLCTTNWAGEADKSLKDPHASLGHCKISANDLLLIEEGRVLTKGHVKIGVWLDLSDLESLELPSVTLAKARALLPALPEHTKKEAQEDAAVDLPQEEGGKGAVAAVVASEVDATVAPVQTATATSASLATTDTPSSMIPDSGPPLVTAAELVKDTCLCNVGSIQLPQSSTLTDLYDEALRLPKVANLLRTVPHVRMRELLGERMGRILWPAAAGAEPIKLKSARVHNNFALCLTPLRRETLRSSMITIMLGIRDPARGGVHSLRPIVYQAGTAPTLEHFTAYVANQLDIPADHLQLRKHFRAKGTWRPLLDAKKTSSHGGGGGGGGAKKGKKKRGGAAGGGGAFTLQGLRAAPSYLRDGDVIAASDGRDPAAATDDWLTDYDRELSNVLSGRASRSSGSGGGSGAGGPKRKEEAISILVPSFDDLEMGSEEEEGEEISETTKDH